MSQKFIKSKNNNLRSTAPCRRHRQAEVFHRQAAPEGCGLRGGAWEYSACRACPRLGRV